MAAPPTWPRAVLRGDRAELAYAKPQSLAWFALLCIAADNPCSFIDDTRTTAKLVRQVLGAIFEFDNAMTVAKLRGTRELKRREPDKSEGRKSHAERNPELVPWRSVYTGRSRNDYLRVGATPSMGDVRAISRAGWSGKGLENNVS